MGNGELRGVWVGGGGGANTARRADSELDQPHLSTQGHDSPPGILECYITWPAWGFIFVVWLFFLYFLLAPTPGRG